MFALTSQVIEEACTNLLPNVVCEYLYNLSEYFTRFYSNCQVWSWYNQILTFTQSMKEWKIENLPWYDGDKYRVSVTSSSPMSWGSSSLDHRLCQSPKSYTSLTHLFYLCTARKCWYFSNLYRKRSIHMNVLES